MADDYLSRLTDDEKTALAALLKRIVDADLTAIGKHTALHYNDRPTGRERRCQLVDHPIGGRLVNRRVGLAVIAGLAAALAGVAAARAAPAVPISTCGYKITTPGKYVLAADLQCPPVGAGIFIAVDLDLNGHTISSGEFGIQVASLGGPAQAMAWLR